MDTRDIYLLLLTLSFLSCDPNSREISFSVENKTNQTFKITLFESSKENTFDLLELSSVEFLRYGALGGGFGAIANFDSIRTFSTTSGKKLEWIKPNNSFGYIDPDYRIGQERDIEKDIYNVKHWQLEIKGYDDEEWIFTINESDLELFE